MSRQIALDTIRLRPTPRLAHTEYSLEYHKDYIRRLTGMDDPDPRAWRRMVELWAIDLNWHTDDGLHSDWEKRGRTTDMGHAVYAADGSDRREAAVSPFRTPEDVWAFDAVAEYGLPDFGAQVAAYQKRMDNARLNSPEQLSAGGYYRTIMSGAIQTFGWEMLLEAAADPARMERVFDGFFRLTLHHMGAWAATDVEVVIQHDDFVWTAGPFMHPDIYRRVIIPRYAELWKPLRAAGKKVLFCSDGDFTCFAEDIVAAGADGLIFEPCNDFGFMAERFGQSTVLVGSAVDCRDMTFGHWETVRRCMGVIVSVGNHLPPNIPGDMMDRYITYLKAHWQR